MSTTVTLTGTGVPHPSPGRAGAGVLVRYDDVAVQFDAGRATTLRLAEADCATHQLAALCVTHLHSDHLVDLADVVMTRWIQQILHPCGPLPIVVPEGDATSFVHRMLDPYAADIAVRVAHVQPAPPELDVRSFRPTPEPVEVWRSGCGDVKIDAVAVRHEPVPDAVAYRVTTPDGVVVISGDTRVCDEVEALVRDADLVVHEACRRTAMAPMIAGTPFEHIFDYHADTVALGAMAQRAQLEHVVLTHLIPQPVTPDEEAAFEHDLRTGGYTGRVTVGRDLMTFSV